MSGCILTSKKGLTLVELLVVLAVLAVVASLVVPSMTDLRIGSKISDKTGKSGESPQEIVTETTLQHVRDAILGTPARPGFWSDFGEREDRLPESISNLFVYPSTWPEALENFDPNTRLGWRGPYLQSTGALYGRDDIYGKISDPAVLDGWGNPIILEQPGTSDTERRRHIRLVSAGPDGKFETPPSEVLPSRADCGDDIVLFLRVPDTRP